MRAPGETTGPMNLPASYSKEQLSYFGWNGSKFTKEKRNGWRSKLNEDRWQHQAPRARYWERKDVNPQ